jgi:hypothetical protein
LPCPAYRRRKERKDVPPQDPWDADHDLFVGVTSAAPPNSNHRPNSRINHVARGQFQRLRYLNASPRREATQDYGSLGLVYEYVAV